MQQDGTLLMSGFLVTEHLSSSILIAIILQVWPIPAPQPAARICLLLLFNAAQRLYRSNKNKVKERKV